MNPLLDGYRNRHSVENRHNRMNLEANKICLMGRWGYVEKTKIQKTTGKKLDINLLEA